VKASYREVTTEPKGEGVYDRELREKIKKTFTLGGELRQRILFIILIVVLVLVGYTIFRPKPKSKIPVQVSEKPTTTAKVPTPTEPKSLVDTAKLSKVPEKAETTVTAKVPSDTTKSVKIAKKPTRPDTGKPEVSIKPDTTKLTVSKIQPTEPTPEEKPKEQVITWGTDPFVRDWVLATEIRDLKLKAVTISGVKAYALINDQILERGEAIMGKRIMEIEKDKVILEQGGRQFTLFLGE